jgi:hypothetical protein
VYRVRQFSQALTSSNNPDEELELARILAPSQHDLFRLMAPNDQRHSANVYATLRQADKNEPDLLVAALLHDVGKSAGRIWVWQRTLIVLLQRWAPGLLNWLSRGSCHNEAPWWRKGFVINRLHPELGARWAAEVGCTPNTVALIRRHQERVKSITSDQDRLLATLQWADGEN